MSDPMTPSIPDAIDTVLGILPGSFLDKVRSGRPKIRDFTQSSYIAALLPQDPRNLSLSLRAALAARMARLHGSRELAAHYLAMTTEEAADPAFSAPEDAQLAAILRHTDLVTLSPKDADDRNITALSAAGLDDRDIVTLAGLIAFVNYQVLVIAGLKMLKEY